MSDAGKGDYQGKVVVVTGGSRGLGRSMVLAFAQAGADLVISSRKLGPCQELAEHVSSEYGVRAVPIAAHVGRWDDCQTLTDRVYAEFEVVDALVNNAGIAPTYPSLAEASEELFDKTIGVNLKGPFRLSALFGERMRAAGRGAIVNISSIAAVLPATTDLVYAAAKAGLNVLTRGYAQALGPEVRVNCVMPGPFVTDISAGWDWEVFDEEAKTFPLRRAGKPEELVGAVLYLAGDAASYTTGTVIAVDGGVSVLNPSNL